MIYSHLKKKKKSHIYHLPPQIECYSLDIKTPTNHHKYSKTLFFFFF